MNVAEFSAEMDVIYENINKNGAPGLDEYEKSVILTHAQEALVKSVLQAEPSGDRFPELITLLTSSSPTTNGFDGNFVFDSPTALLKVLNETVTDGSDTYVVLPISNEQYQVKLSKAYKYPPRRRAWRLGLDKPSASGTPSVEIVARPGITLTNYTVRYVKKPEPIILAYLTDVVPPGTIEGETTPQTSQLNTGLHLEILKFAVTLAETYYYDKYGTDGDK